MGRSAREMHGGQQGRCSNADAGAPRAEANAAASGVTVCCWSRPPPAVANMQQHVRVRVLRSFARAGHLDAAGARDMVGWEHGGHSRACVVSATQKVCDAHDLIAASWKRDRVLVPLHLQLTGRSQARMATRGHHRCPEARVPRSYEGVAKFTGKTNGGFRAKNLAWSMTKIGRFASSAGSLNRLTPAARNSRFQKFPAENVRQVKIEPLH